MAETKFLADEHIDLPAVIALREKGIDVISVLETNLRAASDIDILIFANNENRCVVTRDKDFPRIASVNKHHKGIVFMTKQLDVGDIIREVEKISVTYKPEDLENAVIYIPQK